MRIVTQEKTCSINSEYYDLYLNMQVVKENRKAIYAEKIAGRFRDEEPLRLGRYDTWEKAEEVFMLIHNNLCAGVRLFYMPTASGEVSDDK